MVSNNSSAGVLDTARAAGLLHLNSGSRALSPDSALRLFLTKRRQQPRHKFTSESESPWAFTPAQLALNLNLLASLPKKTKDGDLPKTVLHQRFLSTKVKALASGRPRKLYKRHRNPERALGLFSLRRLLWRSTRRPFLRMDFVNHLRLPQADEPSSDEEFTLRISPSSSPDRNDRSSVSDTTTLTIPGKPNGEEKVNTKRKREATAESAPAAAKPAEDADKCSRAAKKVKTESLSAGNEPPKAGAQTPDKVDKKHIPQTDGKALSAAARPAQPGGEKLKKRKMGDGMDQTPHEHQPAPKKAKPDNGKSGKQAAFKVEGNKESISASAVRKPGHQMEYFELRVHQMLNNPLGFNDLVYDSTKQQPAYVRRSFAKCRRKQRDSTPPLEMSGGIGPVESAKPVNKRQHSENLARNAQKRAHQQRVKEQVKNLKGKSVSAIKKGDERNVFINGQQTLKSKTTLSPNSQYLRGAKRKAGGLLHPTSSKEYTKSTYVEVPTMRGAVSDAPNMSVAIATSGAPTMSGAIADFPATSSAIPPKSQSTSDKVAADMPSKRGATSAMNGKPVRAEKKLPSPDRARFKQQAESGPARTYNLKMFSSLPDSEQPPSAVSAVGPVTPRRQSDAGSDASITWHQTPSSDSPPLSPCYLPDADDIPFVLGCVSGEVFDADPPRPGGTLSKRNTLFAPRRPPAAWSIRKETVSPSPVREGGGKGLLRLFAESRGGCSGNGGESVGRNEEYNKDETGVDGGDDEGYETEETGCGGWEETDVEGGDDDGGEDEHGDMNDTEAETELEDDQVDTLGVPPPSPADDLIRIIDPLGGLVPGLARTTAASSRLARDNTAWPPVTPAPNSRRADNSG
ncbi:hypothetical protein MMYC01_200671 [Madurella mycetomatis]|uniref:Uncharacterized protein n=1 Tax=Madurella mycetomatis TaxID=100816 RepID=A0A175WGR2_9PEZI|nr:hypothetical protein MMYC01_200671 [Madurella mycetomatis]